MGLPNEIHPLQLCASSGAYQINQSLRFDRSSHLSRTFGGTGNGRVWSLSVWVKRAGGIGDNDRDIFGAYTGSYPRIGLVECGAGPSADHFGVDQGGPSSNGTYYANGRRRDPSAWYHLVVSVNYNTPSVKIWVNGVLEGAASNSLAADGGLINSADVPHMIGGRVDSPSTSNRWDGYMAEFHFLDTDSQLSDPYDFGEFDNSGVWRPIEYTGLYGDNGFYLKFDPSATNGIGHDHSGNGNHFTPSGFSTSGTGTDVMSDTPTNNWCTLNPIYKPATSSIAPRNGNLEIVSDSTGYDQVRIGTHAFSSGKWYWEYRMEGTYNYGGAGIIDPTTTAFHDMMRSSTPSITLTGGFQRRQDGNTYSPGVTTVSTGSISNGTVAMFAVDYDTGKVWVGTNGTWYNSGNPAAGTNPTLTIQTLTTAVPFFSPTDTGSQTYYVNWGQRPFEHTQPTGFKALNTSNLPEPTIKKGSKYFNTVLYTGDSAASHAITGVGFQPDFLWIKRRNGVQDHQAFDAVRGADKSLQQNATNAESDNDTHGSFDSDGFTLTGAGQATNNSGGTYVAWNWKANGAGSSNTAGSITSTVSANATAGFSIVTYTSPNSASDQTVGHGLGVKPSFIIVKNRDLTYNWDIYHASLGYNASLIFTTASTRSGAFGAEPTSTVFTTKTGYTHNSTNTYVAYCFSEVAGYSKFGSYTGNGSSDGPFVFTNFKVKWLMVKRTDSTANWYMFDAVRNTYNPLDAELDADLSIAETTAGGATFDFLSNGFKLRRTGNAVNNSGGNYIFMALAENPFKYSNAR